MMITAHNIEQAAQLLIAGLAQHSRMSLERYILWPGTLRRETATRCQIAPAIRRPIISCSVFMADDARRWLRLSTSIGTLLVPSTTLQEAHRNLCSQVVIAQERVIVSCFGASGTFRRWTFEDNELGVSEFDTSPLLPILVRDRPIMHR